MLSLAAIRYRDVLADQGGPVAQIDTGVLPVRGRRIMLANARLIPGLTRKRDLCFFGDADGTGTDPIAVVARYKAVSEALERWAFHATVKSARAKEFAFDVDPSTCGMSAFPGLRQRSARRKAVLEAVERYSLMAWWEGLAEGRSFETDWPGVSAVAVNSPLGGVTVVVYARTEWGDYVYGHAAEESLSAACEHAVVELARHEMLSRGRWLGLIAGRQSAASCIFERRCLFFATEEGHEVFQQRLARRVSRAMPAPKVLCDKHLSGPWDMYASVWRFSLRPTSDGYLRGGERYFFL